MMLEQINKRLARFVAAQRRIPVLEQYVGKEGKVVAIKVPDPVYQRLKALAGTRSMKETIFYAVQAGLAVMESGEVE